MTRELDPQALEAAAEKLASYAAVCSEGNWFDWGENIASDIQYIRDTGEIITAYQQVIAPAVREAVHRLAVAAEWIQGDPNPDNSEANRGAYGDAYTDLLRLVGAQEGDDV